MTAPLTNGTRVDYDYGTGTRAAKVIDHDALRNGFAYTIEFDDGGRAWVQQSRVTVATTTDPGPMGDPGSIGRRYSTGPVTHGRVHKQDPSIFTDPGDIARRYAPATAAPVVVTPVKFSTLDPAPADMPIDATPFKIPGADNWAISSWDGVMWMRLTYVHNLRDAQLANAFGLSADWSPVDNGAQDDRLNALNHPNGV